MSVAIIIVSFLVFVVFITPIMVDYNVLRKYADRRFVTFYIIIKTLIYILYPVAVVFYLEFIRVSAVYSITDDYPSQAYNQSTIKFMAVFLTVVGFVYLLIAKYLIFKTLEVKRPLIKVFIEIMYLPFVFGVLLAIAISWSW